MAAKEAYSLWLQPQGQLASVLRAEIERLADLYGGPRFEPHVTLASTDQHSEQQVVAAAQQLAAQLQAYEITLDSVAYGTQFSQCVYLLCLKDPHVMAAADAARQALQQDSNQPYMPHLSLLYSDMAPATRAMAAEEVRKRISDDVTNRFLPNTFVADKITVWRTLPDDKTLQSWQCIAELALRQQPPTG